MRLLAVLTAIAVVSPAVLAEESPEAVRHQRDAGVLFLHAGDVATVLRLKLEVIQPGKLVTYCQSGDNGLCIPVQLTAKNHLGEGDGLYLASAIVESSLRADVVAQNGRVFLRTAGQPGPAVGEGIPAYNADWGDGRGFSQGDTLPNIPLMDMQGREVRFSKYLGKRYILYCWASW